MRTVLCRQCWYVFPFKQFGVLCRSTECRNGRVWFPNAEIHGIRRRKKEPKLDEVACPKCDRKAVLELACANPSCRAPMPQKLGILNDALFALLGAPSAGKTHFMVAALHRLVSNPSEEWSAEFLDPDSRRRFEELDKQLFRERQEIHKTEGKLPEICLTLKDRNGRLILLPLQDYHGELAETDDFVREFPASRHASGVLLITDPLAYRPPDRPFPQTIPWKVAARKTAPPKSAAEILARYVDKLEAQGRISDLEDGLPVLPKDKSLAVVITKCDWVLESTHSVFQDVPQLDSIDPFDSSATERRKQENELARDWVKTILGPELDDTAQAFKAVNYFFVSSYGFQHKPGSAVEQPPDPLRVVEPIRWLLAHVDAPAEQIF